MKTTIIAAMAIVIVPANADAFDYTILAGGDGKRGGYLVCSDATTPAEAPRTAFFPSDQGDVLIHRGSDGLFYFLTSAPDDVFRQTASDVIEPGHPVLLNLYRACQTRHYEDIEEAKTRLDAFRAATPPGKHPGDGGWAAIIVRLTAEGYL